MKSTTKSVLVALAIPFLMTACANNGNSTNTNIINSIRMQDITAQDLQHHNWQLTLIDGQKTTPNKRNNLPNLEIGENMTANGNAGCNKFFGQSELKNNQFRIEKVRTTMMMCIGDMMETEKVILSTLSDWSDMTLSKDQLILKNKDHTLTYTLRDYVN